MVTLVTPYVDPDLDGTACAFAYSEFLRKTGEDAVAGVFGTPHREAGFVLREFRVPALEDGDKLIGSADKVILVDASDLRGISGKIDPKKVVEIVDHRKVNEAEMFPNAKVQIELVGSAATLIAERFHREKTDISVESAALLFSAIASNTINFQANVTTGRDHAMADWLKTKFPLPDGYIMRMFAEKSHFGKPLKEVFEGDFATFRFGDTRIGIAQLEIVDAAGFVEGNLAEIVRTLGELKSEESLDITFLTCIDVEKAFNELVAFDRETQELVGRVLGIGFGGNVARRDGILMRKEIVPLLKAALEHAT